MDKKIISFLKFMLKSLLIWTYERPGLRNNLFLYFSTKTYVVGTQKNPLNEMVLLCTHNIRLNGRVRKYLQFSLTILRKLRNFVYLNLWRLTHFFDNSIIQFDLQCVDNFSYCWENFKCCKCCLLPNVWIYIVQHSS